MPKHIILYFGSFNPIHSAHVLISSYVLSSQLSDELWLVVSPHNPLKSSSTLASQSCRFTMAQLATEHLGSRLRVSDIEFNMPTPSYTFNTLKELINTNPNTSFSVLMGEDNLMTFDKWFKWCEITHLLQSIFIYPRGMSSNKGAMQNKIEELRECKGANTQLTYTILFNAPLSNLSSTALRDEFRCGGADSEEISDKVKDYIFKNQLYK